MSYDYFADIADMASNDTERQIKEHVREERDHFALVLAAICRGGKLITSNDKKKKEAPDALPTHWISKKQTNRKVKYVPPRKAPGSHNPAGLDQLLRASNDERLILPTGLSVFLHFGFTLKSPWYSSEENFFGPLDNMVCKDRTLGLPMVRPTAWKGCLRTMLQRNGESLEKLFGDAPDSSGKQDEAHIGRLFFYPTFFDKIEGEIITPHTRKTKTATLPIAFEVVPRGTKGRLDMLYCPFDLLTEDHARQQEEVEADLKLLLESVVPLLEDAGFSAKSSNGWGRANVDGLKVTFGKRYENKAITCKKDLKGVQIRLKQPNSVGSEHQEEQ